MDDECVACDPGRLGEAELPEGRNVGADPLLGEELHDRDVREGLRPVDDGRAGRRLAVGAGPGAERYLVVDDEGAAVLAHELGGRDAAERERAILEAGRVGEELEHTAILPAPRGIRPCEAG